MTIDKNKYEINILYELIHAIIFITQLTLTF